MIEPNPEPHESVYNASDSTPDRQISILEFERAFSGMSFHSPPESATPDTTSTGRLSMEMVKTRLSDDTLRYSLDSVDIRLLEEEERREVEQWQASKLIHSGEGKHRARDSLETIASKVGGSVDGYVSRTSIESTETVIEAWSKEGGGLEEPQKVEEDDDSSVEETDGNFKESTSASLMVEELQQQLASYLKSMKNAETAILAWEKRKAEIKQEMMS